ncbi:hypothetical protein SAMN05519104_4389 [Rhizobiales bacterium GAS188]|nr:hypothetical protein SAMN05519104_4389 [Rhizobiales bacterium GAS188]
MSGLASEIATFLRTNKTWQYCDDCIFDEVDGSLDEVREETEIMRAQPEFLAGGDICTRCQKRKPVTTMALASPSA